MADVWVGVEGCTEVVMTLRVPIISSFVEEGDESVFYL